MADYRITTTKTGLLLPYESIPIPLPLLRLYLVSRKDSVDYDEYDSAVVAAYSEEGAVTCPIDGLEVASERHAEYWRADNLEVQQLGVATEGTPPGLVLASFNAG